MSVTKLMVVCYTRDELVAELNAGRYDPDEWQALLEAAREWHCDAIADQVEKYMQHYEMETH